MVISADLAKLRQLFLTNLDIQRQIKNASDPDAFVKLALDIASDEGLNVTEDEFLDFVVGYATKGDNQEPACPTPPSIFDNPGAPPPPTSIPFPALAGLPEGASTKEIADTAIDVIRQTEVKDCSW